jgi:hypothetical protein
MKIRPAVEFDLAQWIMNQRAAHRRGELPPERVKMLDSLPNWRWNPLEEAWEKGYQYTLKYGLVSSKYTCPDGYGLGRWQHKERGNCVDPQRRARLEKIPGWAWKRNEAAWKRAFTLAKKYGVKQQTYVTPCGFGLGSWYGTQRSLYKKGKLSKEKVKLIESLRGWKWSYTHKERIAFAIANRKPKKR